MPLELTETVSAESRKGKKNNVITLDENSETPIAEQLAEQSGVIEDFVRDNLDEDVAEREDEPAFTEDDEAAPKCVLENVRVSLTEKDIRDRTNEYMQTLNVIEEKEKQFASVKDNHKSEMKMIDSQLQRLRYAVSNGWEFRDVECTEEFIYHKGLVEIYRTDTGERVRTRMMTDKERQQNLY